MKERIRPKFKIAYIALYALLTFAASAEARFTEYYTVYQPTGHYTRKECRMEGSQLLPDGRIVDSDCNFAKQYCPWGQAARGCTVPCATAACPRGMMGRKIKTNFTCPWGPLRGKHITSVRCNDVGGAIGSGHYDLFKGICAKKSRADTCAHWAPDDMIASYGSGKDKKGARQAIALLEKAAPGLVDHDTLVAFYDNGGSPNTAIASNETPAQPTQVAQVDMSSEAPHVQREGSSNPRPNISSTESLHDLVNYASFIPASESPVVRVADNNPSQLPSLIVPRPARFQPVIPKHVRRAAPAPQRRATVRRRTQKPRYVAPSVGDLINQSLSNAVR